MSATALRRAFDQSFAAPPPRAAEEVEDLLRIRVAGNPYAIRLREISGLVAGRRVVPVPAAARDLLGLAGLRGGVVPVFGLASILGYGQVPGESRWLILCGGEDPVTLAFSELDGYLRVPKSCLHEDENLRATRHYVSQIARTEEGARPVVSVPLVVAALRSRIGPRGPAKEQ